MGIIEISCPQCARMLRVSTRHIGKSGTCNHCGGRIIIDPSAGRGIEGGDLTRTIEALAGRARCLDELFDGLCGFLGESLEGNFLGKAVLMLMDEQAGGLRLAKTRGQFSQEFLREEAFVPLGKCLCGRAAQSGEVLVCENCFDDPRHDTRWVGMRTHGHYVIPLTHAGRVLGVLALYTQTGLHADDGQMELLAKAGEHAGNALKRLLEMGAQTASSQG